MRAILFFVFLPLIGFSQEVFSVYFDSNEHLLNEKEYYRMADWVHTNAYCKIVAIDGFTDEIGNEQANDSLAKRRVNTVLNRVKGVLPLRDDFSSRSYGERQQKFEDKALNRRVDIFYIKEIDLARENEILGISKIKTPAVLSDDAPLKDRLAAASIGDKIVLKNINFFQNTFATTPESYKPMYDLLTEMARDLRLRIEIQGHICCIDNDRRNLSYERAKQIKRFLVAKGIESSRVGVKGFGVSAPLFPIPEANEEQAAANRRVEIEILRK